MKDVVFDIVNVNCKSGDGTEHTIFYTTVREYVLHNLLRNLVKKLCLTDCYRHLTPTTRLYTCHNIQSFARLDCICVSTFL